MASTYTSNLSVEKPGSGDYVGTWDSPVNSNMGVFDSALGTTQSISLAAGSVTLSTAQTRSATLNFTGTLPGNVIVTIPTLSSAPATIISGRFFSMSNLTNNSSQFTIAIVSTVGGRYVSLPPGQTVDIVMEGSGSSTVGAVKFRNLPPVGSYLDLAATSTPAWIINAFPVPYLLCDGTTFSSSSFPVLAGLIGTTLPDARGRFRATLNSGSGRMVAASGVDGETLFDGGGSQTIAQANLPAVTLNTTIASGQGSHTHTTPTGISGGGTIAFAGGAQGSSSVSGAATLPGLTGTTPLGGSGTAYAQPAFVGGITLIRAG